MSNENRRSPQYAGQSSQPRQDEAVPSLDTSRIKFAKPTPDLFDEIAQKAAKTIGAANLNKPTQLRRFYDEICMWQEKSARQPDKFDELLPFIRMLNAKAAYAAGRKLVDRSYVDLLSHTLKEVNNIESFATCKLFWEAFMGFYKLERPN